ncbi:hypothetical protein ACFWM3_23340 [Gottfriedia sp. NPDC058432]|uniref:COG4315 family predicted lipoprotein n=1 Tax=Gottfriedia sp. NPDC058432 TaxID=3346497 RepID=UPI00366959B8
MKKMMLILMTITSILMSAACNIGESEKSTKSSNYEKIRNQEISTLQLLENVNVGKYLADSKGMALYYFKNDVYEKSNCSGECLKNWPPFTADKFKLPVGFDKNDFGTITREDSGENQVTYKGYPLYYFVNDKVKGDVNGQGIKEIWYIVNTDTTFK